MTNNKTKSGNKKRKRVLVCSRCHYSRKTFSKNQKCPNCGKKHHVNNFLKKCNGIVKANAI